MLPTQSKEVLRMTLAYPSHESRIVSFEGSPSLFSKVNTIVGQREIFIEVEAYVHIDALILFGVTR